MAEKERFDRRGRQDHIVPRGYLRGFIHPERNQKDGPLEVFDLEKRAWADPRTPDELCKETGFYDYSEKAEVTADDAFEELENGLHDVRKKLRDSRFVGWTKHRDFLLRFGKMLAVRSKLFRERVIANQVQQPALRNLGANGTEVRVETFDLRNEPESHLKNFSITKMREEIDKGAEEWARWNWSLRVAPNVECPLVTADHPAPASVAYPNDPERARREGLFAIMIPFGWDFAIIGGPSFGDPEGPLDLSVEDVDRLRRLMCDPDVKVLISPHQLADMRWAGDELAQETQARARAGAAAPRRP